MYSQGSWLGGYACSFNDTDDPTSIKGVFQSNKVAFNTDVFNSSG